MAPPVITVTRQYGSGGSDIARLVAERLGWELVDNQFVEAVARRAGGARQPTGRAARLRRGLEGVPDEARGRAARRGPGARRARGGRDGSPARPVRQDLLRPPPPRGHELRSGRERGEAGVRGS